MLSAKYGFLIKFFINRKVQGGFVKKNKAALFLFRTLECSRNVHSSVCAMLHSSKPDGIAVRPQFLPEKRENAKCFPEFPEKLD